MASRSGCTHAGSSAVGLLAVILQSNAGVERLAAVAARIVERAGKVLGLQVHANVGDGPIAVGPVAEQAAAVAGGRVPGDEAIKVLHRAEFRRRRIIWKNEKRVITE
jgi:hypothetical protein